MNNARQSTYHILPAYALLFRALNGLLFLNVQILFVHLFPPQKPSRKYILWLNYFYPYFQTPQHFYNFNLDVYQKKEHVSNSVNVCLYICQFLCPSVSSPVYLSGRFVLLFMWAVHTV